MNMELSQFTTDELEKKLQDLDRNRSPYEALELCNEIGRRKVEEEQEIFSNIDHGTKIAKTSFQKALVSLIIFIITCNYSPPTVHALIISMCEGIIFTVLIVRSWKKTTFNFQFGCLVLTSLFITTTNHFFENNILGVIQHISAICSVFYLTIFFFKNKILSFLKVKNYNKSLE